MEDKKFNPWLSLWKGLRPALISLIPAVLAALSGVITPEMLTSFGVPTFLAVAIIEAARNAIKFYLHKKKK